jgi:hypothetical protein
MVDLVFVVLVKLTTGPNSRPLIEMAILPIRGDGRYAFTRARVVAATARDSRT